MSVYFLQAKSGPIKIGYSKNGKKRASFLGTKIHEPTTLLGVLEAGTRRTEEALQEHFGRFHRNGEWFEPAPELVAMATWSSVRQLDEPVDLHAGLPTWKTVAVEQARALRLMADRSGWKRGLIRSDEEAAGEVSQTFDAICSLVVIAGATCQEFSQRAREVIAGPLVFEFQPDPSSFPVASAILWQGGGGATFTAKRSAPKK